MNYDTGVLTIQATETLSFVPASLFLLGGIVFAGVSGDTYSGSLEVHGPHLVAFDLLGASTPEVDSQLFNITLTESQRVAGIFLSGTPGGKGSPAVLDIRASTFNDVGFNLNPQIEGLILNEIPDTTPPRITDVSLDYGTGILIFETTENIDVTPVSKLNLSMFNIYDANVANEQFNQKRYYRYYGGTTINLGELMQLQ